MPHLTAGDPLPRRVPTTPTQGIPGTTATHTPPMPPPTRHSSTRLHRPAQWSPTAHRHSAARQVAHLTHTRNTTSPTTQSTALNDERTRNTNDKQQHVARDRRNTLSTSRTGTSRWKQVRLKVLARDRRDGVEHCPECGIHLDYEHGLRRNSAEVDHIIPHSRGGADDPSQCRVICRRCNQSLGAKVGNASRATGQQVPINVKPTTGRAW